MQTWLYYQRELWARIFHAEFVSSQWAGFMWIFIHADIIAWDSCFPKKCHKKSTWWQQPISKKRWGTKNTNKTHKIYIYIIYIHMCVCVFRFKVTFWSPSWRSPTTPLKGHLNIQKNSLFSPCNVFHVEVLLLKTKDCATHEADCQQRSPPRASEATGAGVKGSKLAVKKKTRGQKGQRADFFFSGRFSVESGVNGIILFNMFTFSSSANKR